jgi:hypothetical protein
LKNSDSAEFEFLRAEIEEAWALAPLEAPQPDKIRIAIAE